MSGAGKFRSAKLVHRPGRSVAAGAAGVLGTVLLHALLLTPFLLGAAVRKVKQPDKTGAGSSALLSSAVPVTTMIFVDDGSRSATDFEQWEELASRGFAPSDTRIKVLSPDIEPAASLHGSLDGEDEQSPIEEAAGNAQGRALLFGRYMGQIEARIERAWIRPRSRITPRDSDGKSSDQAVDSRSDETFNCQVMILQDRRGIVQEVTLCHCNGTLVWQQSLIQAIQRASPLPAPASPAVFADTLSLSFSAASYVTGQSEQGFEIPAEQVDQPFWPRYSHADDVRQSGVLKLTIVGDRAGIVQQDAALNSEEFNPVLGNSDIDGSIPDPIASLPPPPFNPPGL